MNSTVDMSEVFDEKKRFYAKNAIALSTLFLSPLLGCIMFSYNLKEIRKGKLAPFFIILSLVYIVVVKRLLGLILTNALIHLLIINGLASLFLTFILWNKFFSDYLEYEVRRRPSSG